MGLRWVEGFVREFERGEARREGGFGEGFVEGFGWFGEEGGFGVFWEGGFGVFSGVRREGFCLGGGLWEFWEVFFFGGGFFGLVFGWVFVGFRWFWVVFVDFCEFWVIFGRRGVLGSFSVSFFLEEGVLGGFGVGFGKVSGEL